MCLQQACHQCSCMLLVKFYLVNGFSPLQRNHYSTDLQIRTLRSTFCWQMYPLAALACHCSQYALSRQPRISQLMYYPHNPQRQADTLVILQGLRGRHWWKYMAICPMANDASTWIYLCLLQERLIFIVQFISSWRQMNILARYYKNVFFDSKVFHLTTV